MADTEHERKFAREWRALVLQYFPNMLSCKYEIEAPNYNFKGNGNRAEVKRLVDLD